MRDEFERVREARQHVREALRLLGDEHHLAMVHGAGRKQAVQAAWLRRLEAHIDRLQEEAEWLAQLDRLQKEAEWLGWWRG